MVDIYYHPISTPALTVLFAAEAIGSAYEKKIVDLQSGEQRSEAYKAINPFSRVPALVDGDFKLSESSAIARYLARKAKSPLYPANFKAQARVDQWSDFVVHHIRNPVSRVQFNRLIAPMIGQEPDQKSLEFGLHMLEANLPITEERLSESAFLCGETMSLADICLVGALEPVNVAQIDISAYPKLEKWLDARRSESFYTNVHSHFGAEIGM